MIKKIKPKSPDPYLSKTVGDNALARIAHVNQLVDQINKSVPYKVYTALLTQSGGQNPLVIGSGTLTIGVTYFLDDVSGQPDFTNVGAPNNESGTAFVATGTTPNSWGEPFTGNVLNYDTGAPVVTVLENTIGNVWFTFVSEGSYYCNSSGLFTIGKTFSNIEPSAVDVENYRNAVIDHYSTISSSNFINIFTGDFTGATPSNNYLNSTPIEIRVYN